jgi:hypothetical protein
MRHAYSLPLAASEEPEALRKWGISSAGTRNLLLGPWFIFEGYYVFLVQKMMEWFLGWRPDFFFSGGWGERKALGIRRKKCM